MAVSPLRGVGAAGRGSGPAVCDLAGPHTVNIGPQAFELGGRHAVTAGVVTSLNTCPQGFRQEILVRSVTVSSPDV
jgi:hypothetical protein